MHPAVLGCAATKSAEPCHWSIDYLATNPSKVITLAMLITRGRLCHQLADEPCAGRASLPGTWPVHAGGYSLGTHFGAAGG